MALNSNLSSRQKMINMMYIVLTAMLALNVSSDVLVGFEMMEEEMNKEVRISLEYNKELMNKFSLYYNGNPERMSSWYEKAHKIHSKSDTLYSFIQDLKAQIIREADGKNFNIEHIVHQDNTEASSRVMLSNSQKNGRELREKLMEFTKLAEEMLPKNEFSGKLLENFFTSLSKRKKETNANWQESLFENMPAIASVIILSKLQSSALYVEGEVLHQLLSGSNDGTIGVSMFKPYLLPTSKNVIAGGTYSAQVVLASIDTTHSYDIYIDGKLLDKNNHGWYEKVTSKPGHYTLKGEVSILNTKGEKLVYPFEETYDVVEPMATVSATKMNLLYLGIDNPISISVPGVSNEKISATMTNGTLKRSGNQWIAKPSQADKPVEIIVTALQNDKPRVVSRTEFRVRPLPSPSPLIEYRDNNGNLQKYRGGRPFLKSLLLQSEGIKAAIDDGILDIQFKVISFETVFFDSMGNAILEHSNGTFFSQRQKDMFKRLSRGKRFYISHVKAVGPDGITQVLNTSMEVIVQ